jgi:hypothetical protein
MNFYQLTILEKDEIHITAIKRFANICGGICSSISTKDGIVFDFEFPTYNLMKDFVASLGTLNPPLFS